MERMENSYFSTWRTSSLQSLLSVGEDEELQTASSLPSIPQPKTPHEPMEFLSRSWSISASEVSKALNQKQKQYSFDKISDISVPESIYLPPPPHQSKGPKSGGIRRAVSIGKWFQSKDSSLSTGGGGGDGGGSVMSKKDRARLEGARLHSAVSVAGLAVALAAVAAEENSGKSQSKMSIALASATELLASHCIDAAEAAGADQARVAAAVRSAVDIRTPGDLMTFTAAAATALRGEGALKARMPKETKRNSSVIPFDKGSSVNSKSGSFSRNLNNDHSTRLEGDLLQLTRKGVQWKRVWIYVNNDSEVIIKTKSKHVGGAFSKNNKCVVYGVCDETAAWPYKRQWEVSEELIFGLKTGNGLLEFQCQTRAQRLRWVEGIQSFLCSVCNVEEDNEGSLEFLSASSSI